MSRRFKIFIIIISIIAILYTLLYFFYFRYFEYTNDAYVEGNKVVLTPLVSGFVTAIHSDDTFFIEKGALLVELDKTDADLDLKVKEEAYANAVREVCRAFHLLSAREQAVKSLHAELIKNVQDFHHREYVVQEGVVSIEEFEHVIAAMRSLFHRTKEAMALYEESFAYLQGTTLWNHPTVAAARAHYTFSFVQRERCNLYAPVSGLVAERKIQVGMQVPAGYYMLSVIPLDQIWINANFKETQAGRMAIGQKAKVTSDIYGGRITYHGRVVGLPGAGGNAFSILPPQNLSGNWIKIVQRLPIRIVLDPEEIKKFPLRLGLSMEATVDLTSDTEGYEPVVPHYDTAIFKEEEAEAEESSLAIFEQNIDPILAHYVDTPLELRAVLTLDEEAFFSP